MVSIKDWNGYFVGSGTNGWIYDSITVKWQEKKTWKGKEGVSIIKKRNNPSKTSNGVAWKTNLGKALRGCKGGFGWAECGIGVAKGFRGENSKSQPQISFSAL